MSFEEWQKENQSIAHPAISEPESGFSQWQDENNRQQAEITLLSVYPESMRPIVKHPLAFGVAVSGGLTRAGSSFVNTIGDISDLIVDYLNYGIELKPTKKYPAPRINKPEVFRKVAQELYEQADYWDENFKEFQGNAVENFVGKIAGGLIPGVSEWTLNVPYAALAGATEAHKKDEPITWSAVKGGAKRYILGKALNAISLIKSPVVRRGLGGVTLGGAAALEGAPPEEVATQAAMGALLAGRPKGRIPSEAAKVLPVGIPPKTSAERAVGISAREIPQVTSMKTIDVQKANVSKYGAKNLEQMYRQWSESTEGRTFKEALGMPEGQKFVEPAMVEKFHRLLLSKDVATEPVPEARVPATPVPAIPKAGIKPTEGMSPEVSSVAANIPPTEPPAPPIGRLTPRPVPPAGERVERGFIKSVKEQFPEMETRIAGQYLPRSTDNLSMQARNLIRDNIGAAEDYARKNANDKAIATTCELIKHYNEQANLTKDMGIKNTLYDKAADIANTNARQLTELGRSVQAASILGRLTPEGQLRFAQKIINDYNEQLVKRPAGMLRLQKRVPNLTAEQTGKILSRAKTIQNMPDGAAKAQSWWELQNYISDLVPVPLYRSIINTWKAGLLTGIKTHGLNTFANIFHGETEIVKDLPAVAVDRVTSLFTGERKLALTGRGFVGGTWEGFKKGWRYLGTGYDERNVAIKYDYRRGSFGKSRFARWIQAYDETVFELMGAEDQPFYYGAKSRSLYSQAAAKAINQGLKGTERKTFVDNLIQNPTDDMIKYATIDAEVAVFQNKTMLGDIARAIQKAPGGEFVVPFGRTPSAVAMQIINYSPIGIPKTIIQNIGKGRFDQRLFSQGIGRGLTGTAILAIGAELWKVGLITLDRPKSEKERELWTLEGRQANSIKIGDKWRTVQTFGPAGNLLVIGGHFQNALETSGSPTEAIVMTLAGAGKSFSEQTFVRGVNQAAEALQDPARSFETFFSQFAGSTVPTIVADTARALDSTDRRTVGPVQRLKGRIPVLRETLEPKVDVFGQDLPRYGGNIFEVMADPTRPVKIKQDVVVDELRRLWDAKIKVSPTLLGDKEGYKGLTPEQNTKLLHRAGQLTYHGLFNLINKKAYKVVDDELKSKVIEMFISESKNIARAEAVIEITNNLTNINKLKEARKSGLLTVEVGSLLGLERETVILLSE